ncbi:MAG: ATP-binding cassette domain-containing protein, partial [Spirochaetaceae bacterium]
MESQLISVRNLHIGFRKGQRIDEVVHGVDLDIYANETLALVGESGSGKTVTAQAILRLFPESIIAYPHGQILFGGRDILSLPTPQLREIRGSEISMIFQEPMTSLNPLHTVEKQINEALFLHRGLSPSKASPITLEWLKRVQLSDPEKKLLSF